MNAVMSLAYNLESYPSCLYEAGYIISRIEPHFNVNGGINPDILFMSDRRGLFAECKGGEYYIGANLEKYGQITTRHLVEKGIDIAVETVELDVGIFGKENLEALKEKLEKEGIFYPQVVMNKFIQKKYGNDFKDPVLQKLFSEPIEIKGKPLIILRFSKESSLKKIAPCIFQTLMKRSMSKEDTFTTRELTEESLGEIWENLDRELKKVLCNKVGQFLRHCKRNHLQRYLHKDKDTWKIKVSDHWKTRDRFQKDCRKTVESLDQTTLFDFGVRTE
ncbi:MAG: hypothetical protein PVF58_19150 [Candidatus Methanofastidiosia archaeon]|jgi:hypothetical protein